MSDFFGISPKRYIKDGAYVTEYASDPKPLSRDEMSDMVAGIWGKAQPLTHESVNESILLYGAHLTRMYVKRETVRRLRLMLKRHNGVAVLGKTVRWRNGRWQVMP